MNRLQLISPTMEYEEEIWQFRQEILDSDDGEDQFAGCGCLRKCTSAKQWIDEQKKLESEETCPEGRVPSHIYLAIRVKDQKLVGIIDLRHHINHPILGLWGGHMGYSVRHKERGQGYAKEMLHMNLQNCRKLNIPKVMVTCSEGNRASEAVILANGGMYEKTVEVEDEYIKRYWISVE